MAEDKFNYYKFMEELKEDFIDEIENNFNDVPTDDEIQDRIHEFADSRTPIYYSEIIRMAYECEEHWDMFFFEHVEEETVVNGTTYALGNTRHEDSNVSKNDFSIYKKVRDGGFEYKDKFYPQEFYVEVGTLDVSPYAKRDEVLQAYNKWLKTNKG